MTYAKLAERAKQLADVAFGEGKVTIESTETDKFFDGGVTFNGEIGIMEVEAEVFITKKKVSAYQVYTMTYVPGVMYHKDGSGTPPDMDVNDVGEPHGKFDDAVVAALRLVLDKRMEDFLVAEDEDRFAKDLAEDPWNDKGYREAINDSLDDMIDDGIMRASIEDRQDEDIHPETHEERLNAIKKRSPRQSLDDGPVAFYHLLHLARAKGFHGIVEFGLREIERLYQMEDAKKD